MAHFSRSSGASGEEDSFNWAENPGAKKTGKRPARRIILSSEDEDDDEEVAVTQANKNKETEVKRIAPIASDSADESNSTGRCNEESFNSAQEMFASINATSDESLGLDLTEEDSGVRQNESSSECIIGPSPVISEEGSGIVESSSLMKTLQQSPSVKVDDRDRTTEDVDEDGDEEFVLRRKQFDGTPKGTRDSGKGDDLVAEEVEEDGARRPDTTEATGPTFGLMTSTPFIGGRSSGLRKPSEFINLNVTAIPSKSPTKNRHTRMSGAGNDIFTAPSSSTTKTDKIQKKVPVEDEEDIILAGIENITLAVEKPFTFKKKETAPSNGDDLGATCSNYYNDRWGKMQNTNDDVSTDGSANFEFEDNDNFNRGNEFSDGSGGSPEVVYEERRQQKAASSSDDDLKVISEKVNKIDLGKRQPEFGVQKYQQPEPRKAIFLNEPPPIEPKTYAYNPLNAKHQEFYGDVQRTVTMLAETIQNMPMPDDEDVDLDDYLPYGLVELYSHQKYGLRWLLWREHEFPSGGILADEMGLGKTIMIIALIMKSKMDDETRKENKKDQWVDQDNDESRNCIPSKTTLVVCPVGCLYQWEEEIANKGRGLRVTLHHGSNRTTSAARLAQYDVVITSYSTIASEMPLPPKDSEGARRQARKGKSPLEKILWKRIVLDEAHNIRNPKTVCSNAICKLAAKHRWAVTGTPVHNRPEDFYAMVKFLRLVPFNDSKVWEFWIGMKALKKSQAARDRMHTVGKALILRRTKVEVQKAAIDGGDSKNVVPIPEKTVDLIELELNEEERRVYDYLMKFSKQMFQDFLVNKENREYEMQAAAAIYGAVPKKKSGKKNADSDDEEVPSDINFSHLFALILRLRQCAILPGLIKTMLEDEDISNDASFDAELEEHIVSKRNPIFEDMYMSTKMQKILEDLEELRNTAEAEHRRMDKVIIVSQWTSALDILYRHLRKRKFYTAYITGRETAQERMETQKLFNNKEEKRPQIILLSLAAGGVGLNLVGGNHVFFMEPHWNPQLELQAQDRAHRFGQEKNVFIRRYIAKNTIEDRILELQGVKTELADGVLNCTKKKKGAAGGLSVAQMRLLFEM